MDRIYQRDADQDPCDAGLCRYHRLEHPRAVGLRRGLKRCSHQPQEDGTVAERVFGDAERHRRSAGVQARERTFWVRVVADNILPIIQTGSIC